MRERPQDDVRAAGDAATSGPRALPAGFRREGAVTRWAPPTPFAEAIFWLSSIAMLAAGLGMGSLLVAKVVGVIELQFVVPLSILLALGAFFMFLIRLFAGATRDQGQGYLVDQQGLRVGHMPVHPKKTALVGRVRIAGLRLAMVSHFFEVSITDRHDHVIRTEPRRSGTSVRVALVDVDGTATTLPLTFSVLSEARFVLADLCDQLGLMVSDDVLLYETHLGMGSSTPLTLGAVHLLESAPRGDPVRPEA
jgi:hypothetical protein